MTQAPLFIHCSAAFTPAEVLEETALLVEGGIIRAIGSPGDILPPPGARVVDARGLIAAPGFIDWQLNGAFGQDFSSCPEGIWEAAARLPQFGVTAFLPTIISSPMEIYRRAVETLKAGPPAGFSGARVLGWHFEGPFLNPAKKGAHPAEWLRRPALADIAGWTRQNGVRLVTIAPELDGALGVIQSLKQGGVVVSGGHSLATLEEARQAFAAGMSAGTHLFNAMPPLDHRSPGLAGALLRSGQAFVGLIPDGVHVHPALVALAWRLKGCRRLALVTDATAALGMPAGEYRLGASSIQASGNPGMNQEVRLGDGTLAGSVLSMDAAVRNLAAFTGCPLQEAVYAATASPAEMLGEEGRGWLRPGAAADILLLTPEGQVVETFIGGVPSRRQD